MKNNIRISSGQYVEFESMTPEDIDLESTTRSLNQIKRFTGHFELIPPLTVAQHTALCMEIAARIYPNREDIEFGCLLHDMPESIYGDMSSPFKRCVPDFRALCKKVDKVFYDTLWTIPFEYTEEVEKGVKHCDLISLNIERQMMWNGPEDDDMWPYVEIPFDKETYSKMFMFMKTIEYVDLEAMYYSFPVKAQAESLMAEPETVL